MTRPRSRRRLLAPLPLLLAGALLAGCGGSDSDSGADSGSGSAGPELSVSDAYLPEPVNPEVAGGFLTLHNEGDADDTLVSATSELTDTVEIHETVDNAMRRVDGLTVPAGGTLRLERGGSHLMFRDPAEPPVEGDTVVVELRFETSEPLRVELPVTSATYTGDSASTDHSEHSDPSEHTDHSGEEHSP
ncbi:copper chaperone PCu(A)C [Streptomyces sp. 3MP-14]|uniref:Copper chaperone PCu(A)C n=1 Tax=Streptomyces mimosae TaxID=2586635 RepID=A0A5N6A6P7_9ACTN|nr:MULTISPECIES: copper chaperone PCu(A)C [Streptomyces]KAB8163400.1 copper chaperone PCu(A)C [Streptomyces mimosae]KAB8174677.1 copper chaperone PCu(A)C [Streptomyces sp. 3MP-14]